MRVVVFTRHDVRSFPWWPVLANAPQIDALLLCRQEWRRTPWLALLRSIALVRRHGALYIPWRMGHALVRLLRRGASYSAPLGMMAPRILDEIITSDMHTEDVVTRVRQFAPDFGISIGAPLLRSSLFSVPAQGTVNLHLGRLPEYAGGPPAFWEVMAGERSIGATVHFVTERIDSGPILVAVETPLAATDSLRTAEARVASLGARALADALEVLALGRVAVIGQQAVVVLHGEPTMSQRATLCLRVIRRKWAARR